MSKLRFPAFLTQKVTNIAFQNFTYSGHQLLLSRSFRLNRRRVYCVSSKRDLSNFYYPAVIRSSYIHKHNTNKMLNHLPFFASGEIVRGFGRGSSELGIPTANFPLEVVKALPAALTIGIYYGWANVDNGEVYKMVMSIGTNPYYDNKEKSMETHIMHKFDGDLYGRLLKVCIVGYLRPECNFDSLEDLIKAIQADIDEAKNLLENDAESRQLQYSKFFQENSNERPNSTTTLLNGDDVKNDSA